MRTRFSSILGPAALVALCALPVVLWISSSPLDERFDGRYQALRSLAVAFALAGTAAFALNLVLGARLRLVSRLFGGLDRMYEVHRTTGKTAFAQTNHQANLFTSSADPARPRFSVDDVVDAYLERGAPAGKLVVGVPFYSRGWTGVPPANDGLYQTGTGPAPGVWEAGANDYEVVEALLGSGFTRHYDPLSGAAWLYGGNTFWTFDDTAVMQVKGQYVGANGLGGIMFWELSGDTPDGDLIAAIANSLGS